MYIVVTWKIQHTENKSRSMGLCYGDGGEVFFPNKKVAMATKRRLGKLFEDSDYAVLKVEGRVE